MNRYSYMMSKSPRIKKSYILSGQKFVLNDLGRIEKEKREPISDSKYLPVELCIERSSVSIINPNSYVVSHSKPIFRDILTEQDILDFYDPEV